ncbi:hypothetical protein GX441_08535 [bacterium]|nr:hypothetical protein [bacterium]
MKLNMTVLLLGLGFVSVSSVYAQKAPCPEGKEQECKEQVKPIVFSGYIQPRWEATIDTAPPLENSFRIRRAYIGASGGFCSWLSYKVVLNLTGNAVSLFDAYADITPIEYISLRAGLFAVPIGMEKLASSSTILFPERTYASGSGKFPLIDRNIGLALTGKLAFLSLQAGVFNGSNILAPSNKDFAARLAVDPWSFLHLGGSYMVGNLGPDNILTDPYDRYGAELALTPWSLWLAGEFIGGTINDTSSRITYYAEAGWLFKLGCPFFYGIQPAVRYEAVDPNTSVADDAENTITGGINLHFLSDNKLKLALCYRMINEEANAVNNDQIIAQLQVKF